MQSPCAIARPSRLRRATTAVAACLACTHAASDALAQSILFDFENAPQYTPLPTDLAAGGVTAHFSATGQGYSIQLAGALGFTPAGFSGRCIYPSSVSASDLSISFSRTVTAFSILYAAQELDCDCSSTLKVTAFMNGAAVGSSTMSAVSGGVWPSATLAFNSASGFNSVVVHYQSAPPCGCDYGVIFMADNMRVTPAPTLVGDLNGDAHVNGPDLAALLGAWGSANAAADLDHDGVVGAPDLSILLSAWTG